MRYANVQPYRHPPRSLPATPWRAFSHNFDAELPTSTTAFGKSGYILHRDAAKGILRPTRIADRSIS